MAETVTNSLVIRDYHTIPGALNAARDIYLFPVVRSTNRRGATTQWMITVRLYELAASQTFEELAELAKSDTTPSLLITDDMFDNKRMAPNVVARIRTYNCIGAGKLSARDPTYVREGANIGKASETNVFCQALRDALGVYNKHNRIVTNPNTTTCAYRPRPMLARSLFSISQNTFGRPLCDGATAQALTEELARNNARVANDPIIFVQPKLNGVRAIATLEGDDNVIVYGRTSLLFNEIESVHSAAKQLLTACAGNATLRTLLNGWRLYLDGELYKHGASLQEISGMVRRVNGTAQPVSGIKLHVYDIFVMNDTITRPMTFSERLYVLKQLREMGVGKQGIEFVETVIIAGSPEERALLLREQYLRFLSEGYEGAIVRLDDAYEHAANNYHSASLLKIKPLYDGEYAVVGTKLATGGAARDAMLVVCKTSDGVEFTVTPMGALAERSKTGELTRKVNEIISRLESIIVYFDELSKDRVPLRARTKCETRTFA